MKQIPVLYIQIVGVDCVYFIQKNALDRKQRTLHIEARNESFSSRISINEHCVYSVSDLIDLRLIPSSHLSLVESRPELSRLVFFWMSFCPLHNLVKCLLCDSHMAIYICVVI